MTELSTNLTYQGKKKFTSSQKKQSIRVKFNSINSFLLDPKDQWSPTNLQTGKLRLKQ